MAFFSGGGQGCDELFLLGVFSFEYLEMKQHNHKSQTFHIIPALSNIGGDFLKKRHPLPLFFGGCLHPNETKTHL